MSTQESSASFIFKMAEPLKKSHTRTLLNNQHFLLWANLCSILGAVASIVLWKVNLSPEIVAVRDFAIAVVMLGLVVVLTFTASRLGEKLRRVNEGREIARLEHLVAFHAITHKLRDVCWSSEYRTPPEASMHFIQSMCAVVLTQTRELLLAHFRSKGIQVGDDVAVTLKLKVPLEEAKRLIEITTGETPSDSDHPSPPEFESQFRLVTLARDSYTCAKHGDEREVLKHIYSINANTAFEYLILRDHHVYVKNDLSALEKEYVNENSNWMSFYNSTIVVPVRYKRDQATRSTVFGIFCVDSKNPGGLDLYNKEDTFEIVSHSADLIAIILFGLHQLKKAESLGKRSHISKGEQNPT